jgi:hypothetical protein
MAQFGPVWPSLSHSVVPAMSLLCPGTEAGQIACLTGGREGRQRDRLSDAL